MEGDIFLLVVVEIDIEGVEHTSIEVGVGDGRLPYSISILGKSTGDEKP